jgi:uncharacterized repeat protein (TIGR03803 family)
LVLDAHFVSRSVNVLNDLGWETNNMNLEYKPTFLRAGRLPALALLLMSAVMGGTVRAEFTVLHSFSEATDGRAPSGVSAQSGTSLFGVARHGAANNSGSIWEYETTTGTFAKLHNFSSIADGATPTDLAADGATLFGTTSAGGASDDGTIWDFAGGFDNRRDFNGPADGASGRSVVLNGGHLYGVAVAGGAGDAGSIWSLNATTASFDNLHSFDDTTDGSTPVGRPVFRGDTLYGTAAGGGANGNGTLWSLDATTNSFANLHDFTFASDGDSPVGDLILSGDILYGTASDGGANGDGTLWSFNTATGTFAQLYDFDEFVDGRAPGGLVRYGDRLIGIAATGGQFDYGTVWSYNTITGLVDTLHDFQRDTDGSFPTGHLVLDGSLLYGGALFGGINDGGTIWSIQVPEPNTAILAIFAAMAVNLVVSRRARVNRDGFHQGVR